MINPTDCILVMGRRGCGKSYLAKRLQRLWPRRIVLDVMREYNKTPNDPNSIIVGNFIEFCEKANFLKEKEKEIKSFELIFQPDIESDVGDDEFNEIMRICYYFGNIQIVIEEIQMYCTPHNLPVWLKKLMLTGRHQNISVLCTSQRPGQINKTLLSQCAHIFCGQLIEKNDLNYVSSFLNQDTKKLTSLQKRYFIWFSDDGIQLIKNEI